MALLRELIQPAQLERCGDRSFPVLSMTMHDGIMLQSDRFKKSLASVDQSAYKVVRRNQLVVGFPIDEGVLYIQQVVDAGIMSPAYDVWNVDETKVDLRYFELCLHSPESMMFYKTNLRGTTARRRSLPKETLLSLPVPVPSMERQREIASALDRLQALIRLRQHQLCAIDQLIKARFVEMFGDIRSNPLGYEKMKLGHTCKVVTGNTPSRSVSEYYGDYIEWIKTDNIVSGLLNPTKANESLSKEGMKVGKTVDSNSILMACIAGSVASIGRVCVTDRTVSFNQQINAIIPESYNTLFLYVMLQLSKEYLVEDISMALKGILSKSKLEDKDFIVPPIEQQEQFAAFVFQVDKSKVVVQEALEKAQLLFDSLMQQFFG